ncbi:cytochrome c-type biogenesis protein CycH [alpha proteobacterium Q-1]|nr:c-type cytochrome biogenesis protein CcmI [Iodidimonas nitroreducens]GAK32478.1 cytochrome c-type biogenesis protein CycH [alpha proteobacterium Q-1]
MIWMIFAIMGLVAFAFPLWAAIRKPTTASRRDADLQLYQKQRAEIDEDRQRGLIDAEEARAARIEIDRRILRLDEAEMEAPAADPAADQGKAGLILVISLVVLVGAYPLYLELGSPQSASLAGADAPKDEAIGTKASGKDSPDIDALLDELEQRLAQTPQRLDGWVILGRTAYNAGQYPRAARAYQKASNLAPDDPDMAARLGEALVAIAEGRVTPAADLAFARALMLQPAHPTALYYVGLGLLQNDRPEDALSRWTSLFANTPPDAPWRKDLAARIDRLENAIAQQKALAGRVSGAAPGMPVLSEETLSSAAGMSADEQTAMIDQMVARLAARLNENPDDFEGWLRLANAYMVRGDEESARMALDRARAIAPADRLEEIDRHLKTLTPQ